MPDGQNFIQLVMLSIMHCDVRRTHFQPPPPQLQQHRLAAGLHLDPLGGAHNAPLDTLASCRGPLQGREVKVMRKDWEEREKGKGRGRREGEVRGGEGRGV
jgi:hypothetical protein